jgi:hypothetical protein
MCQRLLDESAAILDTLEAQLQLLKVSCRMRRLGMHPKLAASGG